MPNRRVRSSIRCLLIVAGLAALDLASLLATARSRYWSRVHDVPGDLVSDGRSVVTRDAEGQMLLSLGSPGGGLHPMRVLRGPPPSTLLDVSAPLIAGASLTVLVAAVAWLPRGVWRCSAVVASLIALNLAAALHRPDIDPTERWLANRALFDDRLILKADGTTEHRPPGDDPIQRDGAIRVHGSGGTVAEIDPEVAPSSPARHRDARIGTILHGRDGSIWAFEGEPGEMDSRPYLIWGPLRSMLELQWPFITSASLTTLIIALSWVQARKRRENSSSAPGWRDRGRARPPEMPMVGR